MGRFEYIGVAIACLFASVIFFAVAVGLAMGDPMPGSYQATHSEVQHAIFYGFMTAALTCLYAFGRYMKKAILHTAELNR